MHLSNLKYYKKLRENVPQRTIDTLLQSTIVFVKPPDAPCGPPPHESAPARLADVFVAIIPKRKYKTLISE